MIDADPSDAARLLEISSDALEAAAQCIGNACKVFFILGDGHNNSNARNFTYLASTSMCDFNAIPQPAQLR
jgi:hypothetical protein